MLGDYGCLEPCAGFEFVSGEICSALMRLSCGQEGHRHRPSTYVQACIMTAALMDSERAR
jgi:hypothetical protein